MSEVDSNVPEGFRQIPGFPRYAIAEDGTILSICRDGKIADRKWSESQQMKPVLQTSGYLSIDLCIAGGKVLRRYVHLLMLTTFVGPRPDGMQCRHLDGNRTNNHLSNLTWGTVAENHHDKILHGTSGKGEKNNRAKLTADDVQEIRRRAADGERRHVLAKKFGVAMCTISRIKTRRIWSHLP